jgi:hypothetical protein
VRSRISQFFSNPSSPSSESTSKLPQFSRYSPTSRCRKVLEKFPKPKEYLSLPHISVHRNPMSIISERDVGRQKLNRKKNLTKGVLGYNLTVTNTDDDKDWEKVIKTCTELIHNKCMLSD